MNTAIAAVLLAANAPLVTLDPATVNTTDATVALSRPGVLRVETGHQHPWPGIALKAPQGKWDLSRNQFIELDVRNLGKETVTVSCRVDNPGADGKNHCVTERLKLDPGAFGTLRVTFAGFPVAVTGGVHIIGMRGTPGGSEAFDPAQVTQLTVFVAKPNRNHVFELSNVRAGGTVKLMDPKSFFPFIDEFGQFLHRDWPGKVRSEADLRARRDAEDRDIATHPGPTDRNRYGGWTSGPQRKATGFFRAEKYQGKWWLVDPEGRLFWSHGVDCVRMESPTPITHREHYFRNLPDSSSPFYGRAYWAPRGYYKDHAPYTTFDFGRANLQRKYGEDYANAHAEMAHRRLRSWGMNTIANWSSSSIYLRRKTPYTATLSVRAKPLEGSQGYWGKFCDVFDPSFREAIRKAIAQEKDHSVNDPWCIGYFVDNELGWGSDTSLAVAALCSPSNQPAKQVFIADLMAKYKDIARLNEAWGSQFASWDDLRNSTTAPNPHKAGDDLRAFSTKTAETYFSTIRAELKKVAPNQLYLGAGLRGSTTSRRWLPRSSATSSATTATTTASRASGCPAIRIGRWSLASFTLERWTAECFTPVCGKRKTNWIARRNTASMLKARSATRG